MKTTWLTGTAEQKLRIKQDFVAAAACRERLKVMLSSKMEKSHNDSMDAGGYNKPNWAYLQADARGYERALREVILLLEEK